MENSNLDLRSPDTSTDTLSPELNSNVEPVDLEGLALLRQIFPEESTEELCKLHEQRILLKSAEKKRRAMDEMIPKSLPSSNIGRKIWRELQELMGEQNESQQQAGSEFQNCEQGLNWRAENLPEDFLRLPAEVAVRRKNDHTGKWEYQLVVDLERRAFAQHRRYYTTGEPLSNDLFFTKVIPRDSDNGLGITLVEDHGRVRIHAVSDLHTSSDSDGSTSNRHKSSDLSIMTGDCVVGVNGYAIFEISFKHHSILRQTVAMIRSSPSPVVLHLQRLQRVPHQKAFSPMPTRPPPESTPALLDTTIDESFRLSSPFDEANHLRLPALHPFAQALASRGLLRNTAGKLISCVAIILFICPSYCSKLFKYVAPEDQVYISEMIQQFIERARQFEFSNSFRIDANTFQLLPNFDNARASYDFEEVKEQTPSTPSTPLRSCNNNGMESLDTASSNDQFRGRGDSFDSLSQLSSPSRSSYPGSRFRTPDRSRRRNADIFIPLMGVRKALCIRILNHFIDGDHVAYTIFVKDVESGVEFYAPLRYFSDFQGRFISIILC